MGAAKTTSGGDHSKTPMLYTRSLDAGRSFSPQRNLITNHYGLDGGGTITTDKLGNVHVLWHATGDTPGPHHRQSIIASSTDNGTTFSPDRPLPFDTPTGACPCCGIRSATSPDGGQIITLLRGATGGQRDALLTSFDPPHQQKPVSSSTPRGRPIPARCPPPPSPPTAPLSPSPGNSRNASESPSSPAAHGR